MSGANDAKDIIEATASLAKEVPIYQDLLQPAAKEVGTALQTIARTVHIALAPVSALVWGYDQMKEFVSTKVAARLANVPEEKIISPKASVAGPTLEALRYCGSEEALSDMYANLLASAMDSRAASGALPAYVEIIKQMTSDEAKLINAFVRGGAWPMLMIRSEYRAGSGRSGSYDVLTNFNHFGKIVGCEFNHLVPTYIDNLCRLGLISVPDTGYYTDIAVYKPLEEDPAITDLNERYAHDKDLQIVVHKRMIKITELGRSFAHACIFPGDGLAK